MFPAVTRRRFEIPIFLLVPPETPRSQLGLLREPVPTGDVEAGSFAPLFASERRYSRPC